MPVGDTDRCPGCRAAVEIDASTRQGRCKFCKIPVFRSRTFYNNSDQASTALKAATNYFLKADMEKANKYAQDALEFAVDNAPAKYIVAFYDRYFAEDREENALNRFFAEMDEVQQNMLKQKAEADGAKEAYRRFGKEPPAISEVLDAEEMELLKQYFLASPGRLMDNEYQTLKLMADNCHDEKVLSEFCEHFIPVTISKQTSRYYLTSNLIDIYATLASKCDMPKSCHALFTSIRDNPDSPYRTDTFHHASAQFFYEEYVLPMEKIFASIRDKELREKYVTFFGKVKAQMQEKMA